LHVAAVVSAAGGAAGEAFAAARVSGGRGAVLAGIEAASLVFPVALLLTTTAAYVLMRSEVRALGDAVLGVATDGRPRAGGPALLLGATLAGVAFELVHFAGARLASQLSARMAVDASVALEALLAVLVLTSVAAIGPRATVMYLRLSRRVAPLTALLAPERAALLGAGGLVACALTLPHGYAFAPTGAALGLLVSLVATQLKAHERFPPPRHAWILPPIIAALAIIALHVLPDDARLAATVRAPYASLVIGAARAAVDHDHDGYSPILLGGDCNDHDATVHPGARDLPDNGIDENCSGGDAHAASHMSVPTAPRPPELQARMNIVMVHLDALRPDHLGFAGYARPTSPHLDRLRASSTWFARAYTPAPTTRYAMASAFTGLEAAAVPHFRGQGPDFTLLPQAFTFAERLDEYDRVGFSISYVVQHIYGIGQGFRRWETPWPADDWARTYGTAATLTSEAALAYLATQGQEHGPFLLFVHYQCTHDPYSARPEWNFGDQEVDHYDSAAAYCDDELGRLVTAIDARDDANRTALVVYSDHGELFGEHGLTSHGGSLFEPDVRVLLLLRLPGATVRTVETPVSIVALAPTVLDLAGTGPRAGSLAPATIDPKRAPERPLFLLAELDRGPVHYRARGVVDGRYKYITDEGGERIYDVARDPGERTNLVDALPALRARFAETLENELN
jgi:hypothetical protein